ncbi:FKBP-type peptidyl-prolyl cis-trans isomerases 1 [Lentisphaera araneosa HTCC2155]|uniref:Peptidyl-prolyl cis-trans isomerase n=1 Tax=Lentisphaera araneosa HTCC2155 TaxID=313628 RepID=A6DH76_9BACT|nr:FKBP-type peptidyl-prolyl cis-trans isomerase [Lentisphaera araneosa]EDM28959.1 FKBP-type peptidyl-prolyl cis-trans isomerases 1 [Lentisphaera araneosa HTCC2155]
MNSKFFFTTAAFSLMAMSSVFAQEPAKAATPAEPAKPAMTFEQASKVISYNEGINLGQRLAEAKEMDSAEFLKGIQVGVEGKKNTLYSQPEIMEAMNVMRTEMQKRQAVEAAKFAEEQKTLSVSAKKEAFGDKQVTKTASGLEYVVMTAGSGESPKATDTVSVHYTGKLLNGTVFDSSVQRGEPIEFPLNGVIPGWTEGVQLMKPGAKYVFYIPSNLAYGPNGQGPIPANSDLIFEVELLKVVK